MRRALLQTNLCLHLPLVIFLFSVDDLGEFQIQQIGIITGPIVIHNAHVQTFVSFSDENADEQERFHMPQSSVHRTKRIFIYGLHTPDKDGIIVLGDNLSKCCKYTHIDVCIVDP